MKIRIYDLRILHGYTKAYVVSQLSCSYGTYSKYESGLQPARLPTLIQLADLYQVSLDYILGMTDEKHRR